MNLQPHLGDIAFALSAAAPLVFYPVATWVAGRRGPRMVWYAWSAFALAYAGLGYAASFVMPNFRGTHLPWAVETLVDPGVALAPMAYLIMTGALNFEPKWKRVLVDVAIGMTAFWVLAIPAMLLFVRLGGDTL